MQYFYKSNKCKAEGASDSDCICWHDEGTGPAVNEHGEYRSEGLTMREKPVEVTKHEKALRDIKKHLELIGCDMVGQSATYRIASEALEK